MSKLPKKAIDEDIFYVRPLNEVPKDDDAPWYIPVHIGRHKLQKMCAEANIKGHKTNHSLRTTAAT